MMAGIPDRPPCLGENPLLIFASSYRDAYLWASRRGLHMSHWRHVRDAESVHGRRNARYVANLPHRPALDYWQDREVWDALAELRRFGGTPVCEPELEMQIEAIRQSGSTST